MNTSPTASTTPSTGNLWAKKMKKIFFALLAVVMVFAGLTMAFLMYANYGEGYRVGTVLKLSRKGVVFKTWEGELSQGFLESAQDAAGGVATRIWYFTVKAGDQEVAAALDHAIEGNKKVKLFYKEKYTTLPWVGDTRYIVFKVEEVQ